MALLEQLTKEKGYLDGRYMAATFNLLRGRDLIWNYVVNNYLLGEDYAAVRPAPLERRHHQPAGQLASRLSRDLYRDNKLVTPGAICVAGTPIDIGKVADSEPTSRRAARIISRRPRACGRSWTISPGPKRFVLAGSGHIAGVVNPPAAGKYQYWVTDRRTSKRSTTSSRARRRIREAGGQTGSSG